ncbi:MAG: TonB-dependent receptor domain-containing protein [Flavisolibacter sp.]
MKFLLLVLCIVSLSCIVSAQNNLLKEDVSHVTGKVIDSTTGQPVEYATISVYLNGNSKPSSGTVTDAKGNFNIDNLPSGDYEFVIGFIGYQSRSVNVPVTGSTTIQLNTIRLLNSNSVLSGVTVTASRPLIENKIDKLVYNVDRDLSSQGGVATDVLKKVPQVTVDIDGNVQLQGSSSIRFLIDGKPSSIFGNSLADALQSIPASQIQSIEVITNPGAKYDAQGTGGIINIILKKSRVRGINGNLNLSAGTRLENGSFNLNFRHDNFGMHAYFSGNAQRPSITYSSSDRHSFDSTGRMTDFLQNSTGTYSRQGYQTGVGLDWSITKKDNISASFGYNHFGNHYTGITDQHTLTDSMGTLLSDLYTTRNSESRFSFNSLDWDINYKKTFKKEKQELEINYTRSQGKNTVFYLQNQVNKGEVNPFSGTTSNNPGNDNETNLSIDYTHPVTEKITIETGAKLVQNKISSIANVYTLNSGSFIPDPSQSYVVDYKRNVYAYYLSGTFSLFQFLDIRAGGRYEYTSTNAQYSNAHDVSIPPYNTFAPSFVLSHTFSNNQVIKLSYSYRIERPDYRDLNPFMNLSDPHNISTGNPLLQPEIGNNYELGYNKTFEKGTNINVAAFYRKNTHDIKSYVTYYPEYQIGDSVYQNVSLSTRENIGMEDREGINISISVPVTGKFNLRSNTMVANRHIVNNFLGGTSTYGLEYRINLNGSFQFKNDLALEMFGNYNSPIKNVQGKQPGFVFYNMAIRKQFLHKNASIAFVTANPFNRYVNQTTELTGPNFYSTSFRQIPLRSFGISLTYKFGKLEFKKPKEEEGSNMPGLESNNN